MTKKKWKEAIEAACREAGTYKPFFDTAIDTLAGIMEMRDKAQANFKKGGSLITVEHTNKGGNTNIVKNPALTIIDDLNRTALAYWRDLGLTPAGLKRLNADAMTAKGKGAASLGEVLKDIGI